MLSLFESYNARFVDPATVADTFVLRDKEFHVLCEQNNSLIVGPRGSGKTTLLKMLKVGAQIRWKNQRQAKVLRRFSFAPIYVGADRQFELMHGTLRNSLEDINAASVISKALFASRVKFACLETLQEIGDQRLVNIPELSHQYLRLSEENHIEVCQKLSDVWDLGVHAVSYIELKVALRKQIADINKIVQLLRYTGEFNLANVIEKCPYIIHDPIHVCQSFIDVINATSGNLNKVWALCIDELEIMPDELQEFLFSCLRSTDQRIVLKLATSPFSRLSWSDRSSDRPMAGHDFSPINLSFGKKVDARRFSVRLFEALLRSESAKQQQHNENQNGRAILGRSVIEEANSSTSQRQAYSSPNGYHYRRFAKLRQIDPSFRSFLESRKIDIDRLADELEHKRAGNARKYIWQVATRLEYGPNNKFRKSDRSIGNRSPSKKRAGEIYLGYDSLITICEGNPRTIIGLARPLIRRYTGTSSEVEPEYQARALQTAIAKYFSLLSSIPVGDMDTGPYSSVIELIDDVGEYLSGETNGSKFKAEPSLSLIIDSATSSDIMEAIGNAMNQGAFVMLSDEIGLFDYGALIGARLRLSYLLCPRYHLPLTFGQGVTLSTILRSKKRPSAAQPLYMKDLFDASTEI